MAIKLPDLKHRLITAVDARRGRDEPRSGDPSRAQELLASLDRGVERIFHEDPDAALAAFAHFNEWPVERVPEDVRQLITKAVEFNYVNWPRTVRHHLHGRSVLDIGCGHGLHAIGYLIVGVASYTGVDPKIDLDSSASRNKRRGQTEDFGTTPRELGTIFPRLQLIPGLLGSCGLRDRFELVVMHNVTEHLPDLEGTFAAIPGFLRSGGALLYNHHNYYCWNGHHRQPKRTNAIDLSDDQQRQLVDWGHVRFDPPPDHYIATSLNRITLEELRALTERYYEVEMWDERRSRPEEGAERLNDEVRRRLPELTDRELLTQNVRCLARPRGTAKA